MFEDVAKDDSLDVLAMGHHSQIFVFFAWDEAEAADPQDD
jgi:hypothetical protein